MAIYYRYDGSQTRGIIFIADGGKFGLDSVSSFEYKGSPLTPTTEWLFHRGTFTKQISPKPVTVSGSTFTSTAHPYVDGQPVRLKSIGGNLPVPLSEEIHGQSAKYYVNDATAHTFKLEATVGGGNITITDIGTGDLTVWDATDSGFDDQIQGLPEFCPEVQTTFNNIAYIEFKLPSGISSSTEQPDWQDFRIYGTGRRLMDYDADGNEVGVVSGSDLLGNPALIVADNYLWNYKGDPDRIDWESWFALREHSNVEILYQINTSETSTVNGLTARYFGNDDFTNQIVSRLDPEINIPDSLPTVDPATGVSGYGFSVIWKGQMKPRYTELYTLSLTPDNDAELFIDGQSILTASLTTATTTYSFIADQLYDVEIRFRQLTVNAIGNHYRCEFKWQSATQGLEIVPETRLFPSDEIVKRSLVSLAFNSATEASEVHERIMERAVGWDWTDNNGKIVFLPPDRPTVYTFEFDRLDDDSRANFLGGSFEKRLRPLADRENFKLGRFRNLLLDLYPFQFVQADRENLRLLNQGEPSNSPYIDIGVMSESQAKRFLEMEMTIKSDPDHVAQIAGHLPSSGLRKCQWIMVRYIDEASEVVNQKYEITYHAWGDSASRNDFSLLPIPLDPNDYYSDEPIEI